MHYLAAFKNYVSRNRVGGIYFEVLAYVESNGAGKCMNIILGIT